jgi:hypothetical protein
MKVNIRMVGAFNESMMMVAEVVMEVEEEAEVTMIDIIIIKVVEVTL